MMEFNFLQEQERIDSLIDVIVLFFLDWKLEYYNGYNCTSVDELSALTVDGYQRKPCLCSSESFN